MEPATTTVITTDWQYWVGIVVATGLISAAWTTFWTFLTDHWKGAREGKATALRAAIALERYAIASFPVAYMGQDYYRERGQPWLNEIYDTLDLPGDAEWKQVEPHLTDEALSFRNLVALAQIRGGHAKYFEGNPYQIDEETLNLGRRAWDISEKLRRRYSLPEQRDLKFQLKELLGSGADQV